LDTDHITILQRQAGPEFAAIMAHIALHLPSELAFSIISLHEPLTLTGIDPSMLTKTDPSISLSEI
jgi:hypothetical protein